MEAINKIFDKLKQETKALRAGDKKDPPTARQEKLAKVNKKVKLLKKKVATVKRQKAAGAPKKVTGTTEEGWKVYSEDFLKLNTEGGATADCPFDCDCCF
jgi:septation ring formation regulator EzrA